MKKVVEILKNVLKNNVIVLTLFIFIVEMLFKILSGYFSFDYSILRILLSSYFLSIIINLIKNKLANKIVSAIIYFIITIYSFCQLGFYNFLGNYISVNSSSQLGKVTDYIKDFFDSFKTSYYIILIPFIIYLIYLYFNKEVKNTLNKKYLVITPVVIVMYILTMTLGFMQNKYQYMSNVELFHNPSIPSVTVNQFGTSMFAVIDIKSKLFNTFESEVNNVEIEIKKEDKDLEMLEYIIDKEQDEVLNKINKFFYNQDSHEDNEYTGVFKDKNLIMIMLESIGNVLDYPEYFPNLSKLYNEGISFTNNYSPRNTCATGNNEFSALTSLFTINHTCSANMYRGNSYTQSIFNIFKNSGYETSSYHNYTEQYYYRSTIHEKLGSGKYYGVEDLEIPYDEEYKEWPSDVDLIEKSYKIFSQDEKYMAFLTTVTSHQPYSTSSEYGDKYLSLFKNLKVSMSVKRYFSKVKELDNAIGRLLELLEEDGKLDDTVIVMFGDHYPYGIKTNELQKIFDYDLEENMEIEKTPFVIYNSQLTGRKMNSYTTYMNILPTIANMFDLEYDSRFYMGEDLFSKDYSNIAIFTDGSWQSKYAFYDAAKSKLNYINDNYKYTSDEVIKINETINQKISMSNMIITRNYFNYLEKEMEEYNNLDNENNNVN